MGIGRELMTANFIAPLDAFGTGDAVPRPANNPAKPAPRPATPINFVGIQL